MKINVPNFVIKVDFEEYEVDISYHGEEYNIELIADKDRNPNGWGSGKTFEKALKAAIGHAQDNLKKKAKDGWY